MDSPKVDRKAVILVCCHNNSFHLSDSPFFPIHCGKAVSKLSLDMPGDDTGDNISVRNPYFCELTALYWLWKNGKDYNYCGLNHYRRYFDFSNSHGQSMLYTNQEDMANRASAIPPLDTLFEKYDIVLQKKEHFHISIGAYFGRHHRTSDLEEVRKIIDELYTDFSESFSKVIDKGNTISHYNMFITRREIFNEYCEWLFGILFELEKRIVIPSDPYQSRVFGFLAERLLNVFVDKKNLRVCYKTVVSSAEGFSNKSFLGNKFSNLWRDVRFLFFKFRKE